MPKLLRYITMFLVILSSNFAFAKEIAVTTEQTSVAPSSQVILELIEEDEQPNLTIEEKLNLLIKTGKEFNNVIEGDKINEDFTGQLSKYFPKSTENELFEKQKTVRSYMRVYRYFEGIYDDIKAKMIVPQEQPLVVEDDEYDMGYDGSYIEVPEGQTVVVTDFKKVLAYGSNPKDREAMAAKRQRDLEKKEEKTRMEEMWITLSKVDWKNTLFGSTPMDSPFTGNLGSGEWVEADNIKVRILSEVGKVDNRNIINMVLNFDVKSGYFLQVSALENNPYIMADFSASENLKSTDIFYPVPTKIDVGDTERIMAYGGVFSIPFTVYVDDIEKNLNLYTRLSFILCDADLKCNRLELNPKLKLEKGETFPSQYENYVKLAKKNIPRTENKDLKILSVSDSKLPNGEKVLKIVFDYNYSLSNFEVFVESLDELEMARPRVSIDGSKIIARVSPLDQSVNLVGKKFLITGVINNIYPVRNVFEVQEKSLFEVMSEKLSLPLLFLAVLGGFLLNFMPCVFPVLSIKLISLNKIGGRNVSEVKKSFYLTILGILITFFILSLVLCLIKYLGYSIGWGMQFQNPFFLICMIFVIVVFIGYIFGFQRITTPKWLNNLMFKTQGENNLLYFMTGVLAVVMATPCTAPYLGTTIGFALAGSYVDIITILMSVGLGLSLPYIFFTIFPSLAIYVPKPGEWMDKLNRIMILMLIITLFWLISIYYAQTNAWAAGRMVLYSLVFMFVLWFRNILMLEIDIGVESDSDRKKLKKRFNCIALFLIVGLFVGAMVDGAYNFMQKKVDISQERGNKIDMDEINQYIKEGKIVVVNVQADWCLTCLYNDFSVFSNAYVQRLVEKNNVKVVNIDWTNYNKEVLAFMEKYGRKGLPFYIVYSKKVPDGMVLPEILNDMDFTKIINSVAE